ncbi:MAG: helix-turn-helix transcriptional regulator [Aquidulcibacter sp.]
MGKAPIPIRHLHQTDLARRWSLSVRTLERWRYLNQGPAFLKLGGRVLYRITDIERFEAAQTRFAPGDQPAPEGKRHGIDAQPDTHAATSCLSDRLPSAGKSNASLGRGGPSHG